ncbi:molybdopterin-dependent oxidoreductase [Azospirillum agricola]|uniref:molybdopterin-dependent oxidoreductase n=1 Tax=Azospirillum agricola TaxID=1720247 RepID=UPI000A0F0C78|nr:molybdopterin-dependent oxidoreductase [Azospirillum agricola]SMH38810.1 Molybdopterin oxidoreductase [Azospirillum lipoferum]
MSPRWPGTAAARDKPGANISTALHGNWVAGAQRIEDSDVWMIVGGNPVISKSNGAPPNNPAKRLKDAVTGGLKLIVVDPRRTETAKRAALHLAVKPGEDPALLAGIIHVIIAEGLHDRSFLAAHAQGFERLRDAVRPFTPDSAAARAGVPVDSLLEAARVFAGGRDAPERQRSADGGAGR